MRPTLAAVVGVALTLTGCASAVPPGAPAPSAPVPSATAPAAAGAPGAATLPPTSSEPARAWPFPPPFGPIPGCFGVPAMAAPSTASADLRYVLPTSSGGVAANRPWPAPLTSGADFARIAALIHGSSPASDCTLAEPPFTPADHANAAAIGLADGTVWWVSQRVCRPDPKGDCPWNPDIVEIGGVPMRAPGLWAALAALRQNLPAVAPVRVESSAGGTVTISGDGWVGATVQLAVPSGDGRVNRPVADVPVRGGHFQWTGRLPATALQVFAQDGVREAVS